MTPKERKEWAEQLRFQHDGSGSLDVPPEGREAVLTEFLRSTWRRWCQLAGILEIRAPLEVDQKARPVPPQASKAGRPEGNRE